MIPLLLLLALGGLMQAARSFSADISIAGTELAFGYLLLAAYFTAKIVSRFGLPKLTGYLMAGVISGPFVFGLVTKDMAYSLRVVSDTATAIIALEAGSELQIKKIRPLIGTLRAMVVLGVIGGMFMIGSALFLMRSILPVFDGLDTTQSIGVCLVIGVALSAQSPAVVMALLAETRAEGPLSSTILASVVVADLTVIVCFSVASAITSSIVGGDLDVVTTALSVSWELFGSMIFGVAIGMVIARFLISIRTGAALFALMVCVVVAEIGARMHLDPLIVLLASGIWLRNFSRADATDLLSGFESAQLPVFLVFFALAGSKIELDMLWASIIPVFILAFVRASSRFVGGKLACKLTHAPDIVTRYGWYGFLPQAGLALALALVLIKTFPSFGGGAAALLFGVVGFNECVAPVILRAVLVRSGEAGKKPGIDFAAGGH